MTRILAALGGVWLAACGSPADDAMVPDGLAELPIGEWSWLDVPGATCANGTPTGLGINRGTSGTVVIYMSGGSACLDERCTIGTPSMRKDGGFGPTEMQACVDGNCDGSVTFPAKSLFNRAAGASPFTDATHVFISNCSGDYYVGDGEHAFASWTAQFHGSRNQALFAATVAAWSGIERVVLTGGSAGAVGAALNYWQWLGAFPTTRVDLITDSFAFVFEDGPEWRFDLHAPQLPPDCPSCVTDYRTIHDHNATIAPAAARIAVLDAEDNFTLDLVSGGRYTGGLEALQPRLAAHANTRYFVANGNVHILVQHALDSTLIDTEDAAGTTHLLSTFLEQMASDDPAWQSHSCLGPVP